MWIAEYYMVFIALQNVNINRFAEISLIRAFEQEQKLCNWNSSSKIYSSMERYIFLKEIVWSKTEQTQLFLEDAVFDEKSNLEIVELKLIPYVSIDKS